MGCRTARTSRSTITACDTSTARKTSGLRSRVSCMFNEQFSTPPGSVELPKGMRCHTALMRFLAAIPFAICLIPCVSRSAELNLATLTCGKDENDVLPADGTNPLADSLNTVMWLFGYSVAKSGGHVMYSEALAPFGFALDNECKSNPGEGMLEALAIVKPETKEPLDLAHVECGSFASRHAEFARSDTESANTIMMWLFGFSVAKSGSDIFDADSLQSFETALLAECGKHPQKSLLSTVTTLKVPKSVKASTPVQ